MEDTQISAQSFSLIPTIFTFACIMIGFIRLSLGILSVVDFIKRNFFLWGWNIPQRYGQNSWVLITGSTSGIGFELWKQFARKGMNIILLGRDEKVLVEKQKEIADISPKIYTKIVVSDLGKTRDVSHFRKIYDECKDLDISILVNNAGLGLKDDFKNSSIEDMKNVLDVNVYALLMLSNLFAQKLAKRPNRSAIINLGSLAGVCPLPYFAVYSSSKAFVRYLSFAIGEELKDNIDVLCPTPGYVSTRLTGFKSSVDTANVEGCAKNIISSLGKYREHCTFWIHDVFNCINCFMTGMMPYRYIEISKSLAKGMLDERRDWAKQKLD